MQVFRSPHSIQNECLGYSVRQVEDADILKFSSVSLASASARLAALYALRDTSCLIITTTLALSRRCQSKTCGDATLFRVQRGSSVKWDWSVFLITVCR